MTDNRTTELRGKLTERGVEYRGDDASYTFATHWTDSLGRGCSFVEEVYDGESKTMFVSEPSARNITPEQAIAATLGDDELNAALGEQPAKSGADALVQRARYMAHNIQGNLGRCLYRRKDIAEMEEVSETLMELANELNATLGAEINGDTSDGYHTFNELYYHRTALFACLVALQPRQMAFKSWKHSDGTMYEGMFIAGIYTSGGWCTYHCEAKWWPLFDCHEREFAPEWDGHTPSDAINRLMSDFLPCQDVSGEVSE